MVLAAQSSMVVRRYQITTDDALQRLQSGSWQEGVFQVPGWVRTTYVEAGNRVFLSIHTFILQGTGDQKQAALASAEQANSIEEAWVEQNLSAFLKGPVEATFGLVMGESG
jgi:predicted RecA/RadA family phage recombinase